MAIYDYSGNAVKCIKCINHRGYMTEAPENTLPAYELSAQHGFKFVETDISFTSDNVAVLLHDATIDRTSDGTGNITDLTYAQVLEYDFGSWFSEDFAGTKIPTLAQFLDLCVLRGFHPYLELKNNATYTRAQIQAVVDMVHARNLDVTYISFSAIFLGYVRDYDSSARLGFLVSSLTASSITTVQGLMTNGNEVFLDSKVYGSSVITLCRNANIPLEIWTLTDLSTIPNLNSYISGATANSGTPTNMLSYMGVMDYSGIKQAYVRNADGHFL